MARVGEGRAAYTQMFGLIDCRHKLVRAPASWKLSEKNFVFQICYSINMWYFHLYCLMWDFVCFFAFFFFFVAIWMDQLSPSQVSRYFPGSLLCMKHLFTGLAALLWFSCWLGVKHQSSPLFLAACLREMWSSNLNSTFCQLAMFVGMPAWVYMYLCVCFVDFFVKL